MQKTLGWIHTLPEKAELDVLIETRQQLSKIQFEAIQQAKLQIDLVLEIDRNTYRYAKKETHKYLTILRINKKLEASIYNAAYLYYRQLYISYTQFLVCYEAQNKVLLSDDKMNLILCRLLNAAFAMAKWRYFDDQPAPAGMWTNVHKVIRFAENLSIMNNNLFLYNFHRKETSIATILKQGFMMDTLHKGNYSRLQIQLTEQVLKLWATNPIILNKYRQDKVQFFINLEADKGPERIRAVEKYAEYRFWKTTRLVDRIEAYLCAVDTQKPLTEFGLDKMAPPSVVLKLFKKLRAEWCVEGFERQRRREARLKSSKLLSVSFGLEDIYRRLEQIRKNQELQAFPSTVDDEQIAFDMKLAQQRRNQITPKPSQNHLGTENWWMVDESSGGFAVDLGKEINHWIEPGVLIGYSNEYNKNALVIAEIKSVRKQVNGCYRAGLEIIGAHCANIKISRADSDIGNEAQAGYFVQDNTFSFDNLNAFEGILLKNTNLYAGKNTLILPRNAYKRGTQYMIQADGAEKLVQTGVLQMKQREWVGVELPD
ncbi:MAG: hypothetical protein V4575_00525 [Pseudomonadota bacterium]